MAATTKLTLYNDALRELGSSPLANLAAANTRLQELDGAFPHAVEYMLAKLDWSFARRRSTLTGVTDSSFPPYTYRFSKPSNYLRKCWLKTSAYDAHEIDHAEVAAVFYSMASTTLIEFMSDASDNYDPANWPPHFTRCVSLYLAQLIAPKVARAGSGDLGTLQAKLQAAMEDADAFEVIFLTNTQIDPVRQPVLRRAIEILGQESTGTVAINSQANKLRWQMNQAWEHTVKYCLEQGAWNHASRRALLTGGTEPMVGDTYAGIIEGYTVTPATEDPAEGMPDMAGFTYGFPLPDDFLHKIWLRDDAGREFETHHQFLGRNVYTNTVPVVMEYVALNEDTVLPTNWPATFLEMVAVRLAMAVSPELVLEPGGKGRARVAAPQVRVRLDDLWKRALYGARGKDAIQQEPKSLPRGNYVRARMGGNLGYGRTYR